MLSAGGVTRAFLIDTGADTTSIEESLAEKLMKKSEARVVDRTLFVTLDGERHLSPLYLLRKVSLGPFTNEQLLVNQGQRNRLGLRYLSRYGVTFAFPKPVRTFDRRKIGYNTPKNSAKPNLPPSPAPSLNSS